MLHDVCWWLEIGTGLSITDSGVCMLSSER